MEQQNVVKEKSYDFAIRILEVYKILLAGNCENVLSRQLLRCGTSIGSNIEEAVGTQSKKDFIHKIFIAYKEARETHYWIRLLRDTGYLDKNITGSLLEMCDELLKLTGKIISTSKKSLKEIH